MLVMGYFTIHCCIAFWFHCDAGNWSNFRFWLGWIQL